MFIVKINNAPVDRKGQSVEFFDYYLRSTTWTGRERAQQFTTLGEAHTALAKAAQFMKKGHAKRAEFIEL